MSDEARRAELAALIEKAGWTNTPFTRCSYCGKDWDDGIGHEHGQGTMDPEPPYGFIMVHEDKGGTIKFDAGKAADAVLDYVADAVAQAVERCAQIAEGFESPFSQEFPAEAWRGRLQTVILQALLSAPKDGDDTQPERAIADAVFSFLQTGRDRMDELFKTGNASAAIRAETLRREPAP